MELTEFDTEFDTVLVTEFVTEFDTLFAGQPVMALFRNLPAAESVALAHRAWDAGIDLVEVPIQTADAVEALLAVVAAGRERGKLVGSGTVTTLEQVSASRRAGVAFTVAPGLDPAIVQESVRLGVPHLPGVATPTEVQQALALGCTWLKAFPAIALGPVWFRALAGPFPQASFVATGGLDASNASDFLAAGVKTVAVGSALADPQQLERLARLVADIRRSRDGGEP